MTGDAEPNAADWRTRLTMRLRAEPRRVPGIRALRTGLRTAHIIAFGALYGGHVYGVGAERLLPALYATLASGGAFLALEVYRAPVWLVQVRGVATFVKLLLVMSVALLWDLRIAILTLAIVIGAVTSHMPSRFRYHSWLHGGAIGPQEKG
jgi:hypothetical protein